MLYEWQFGDRVDFYWQQPNPSQNITSLAEGGGVEVKKVASVDEKVISLF